MDTSVVAGPAPLGLRIARHTSAMIGRKVGGGEGIIVHRCLGPQSEVRSRESQGAWGSVFIGVRAGGLGSRSHSLFVKSKNLKCRKGKKNKPQWSVIEINQNLQNKAGWGVERGREEGAAWFFI